MADPGPRVALVVVSHSKMIAEGTRELALEMAPDVHIGAAGGNSEGGLGSSFDAIERQIEDALSASGGRGVAVLTDLGSATLTVSTVIEFAEEPSLIRYAPGPLVEGAVAGAVAAQIGGDLDQVIRGVNEAARNLWEEGYKPEPLTEQDGLGGAGEPDKDGAVEYRAIVADPAGIHARPAAKLANIASQFDAQVWINGADGTSTIEIAALGVAQGETVVVMARGPEAQAAASAVAGGIMRGLDA